jgi:hypothetical protein
VHFFCRAAADTTRASDGTVLHSILERAEPSDRLEPVTMGNFNNRTWELGSWTSGEGRRQSTGGDRKRSQPVEDLVAKEQKSSRSWLWDEVGHRKALFDRIGSFAHQG